MIMNNPIEGKHLPIGGIYTFYPFKAIHPSVA
jgi:hypothetical protein